MQALQETMVASRADQEHIHIDLAVSLVRNEELQRANEELRKDLCNQVGEREVEDQEPMTPPMEFSMPFSQAIMDAVIPATFVGPKPTFTGVEDPEAHLMTFHTQMMLVGGSGRSVLGEETSPLFPKLYSGGDGRPAYLQGPAETGRGRKEGTMGSGTLRVRCPVHAPRSHQRPSLRKFRSRALLGRCTPRGS